MVSLLWFLHVSAMVPVSALLGTVHCSLSQEYVGQHASYHFVEVGNTAIDGVKLSITHVCETKQAQEHVSFVTQLLFGLGGAFCTEAILSWSPNSGPASPLQSLF